MCGLLVGYMYFEDETGVVCEIYPKLTYKQHTNKYILPTTIPEK